MPENQLPSPAERLMEFDNLAALAAAAVSELEKCEQDPKTYIIDTASQYECSTDQTGRKVVGFVGAIVQRRFGLPPVHNAWNPSKSEHVAERDRKKLEALAWLANGRVDVALEKFYGRVFPESPNSLIPEYATDPDAWRQEMGKLIRWLVQCKF